MKNNIRSALHTRSKALEIGLLGFLVLGVLSGIGAVTIDMYLPAFPAIAESLEVEGREVEISLGIFLLSFAFGQLIHGPLADCFGRKPVLVWGLLFFSLASAGCALSVEIGHFHWGRLCQGIAGASGAVLARVVIRDLYEGEALAKAMSMLMIIMTVAPMLAPLLGSVLLDVFGWRSIFWFLTGFALIFALLIMFLIPETLSPNARQPLHPSKIIKNFSIVLSHRVSLGFILCGSFSFGAMFAFITGSPLIYTGEFGISPKEYAYLFGLNILAMALGSYLNGRYIGTIGRNSMIRLLTLIMLSAATLLFITSITGVVGLWGLVILIAVYIGCIGGLAANCIAGALEPFRKNTGTASSVWGVMQFGLGSLGGGIMALLGDSTPMPMATVIWGLAFLSYFVFRVLGPKREQVIG